jgi:uncharacterized protein YkwD
MRRVAGLVMVAVLSVIPTASAQEAAATQPTSSPGLDLIDAQRRVIELTNEFRRSEKLSNVRPDPALEKAAAYFAGYLARTGKFSHTADGQEPSQRAAHAGYEYCIVAENIEFRYDSRGFDTDDLAGKLVESWKRSPEHRKNMLDPGVTQTGVAIAFSAKTGRYYAVQMFGRPKSAQIRFGVANRTGHTAKYRIGKQDFALPPDYMGTHTICRPADLVMTGSSAIGTVPAADRNRLRPRNGGHYSIRENGKTITITPEP